ncbi:hypothetical protein O6H91_22G018200 [Diphasiastrum complanatum]|uniref:Uncharacterized protein n=2 Tax=Diphasiastrum complanatum TaxID=34168 RepID=A0ACC2ADC4_DIPCM|nr:hypothetical protein O6H91_22G018200 [Diphasiastrum complanatum]KAJ7515560.1 hypothetical protein O6H91_22G018200 [Diphasiastrum complanatum]
MASVLPFTRDDVVYDNAKFKRRSPLQAVKRTLLTRGLSRLCGSSGLGKLLALFLLAGLGYLAIANSGAAARPSLKRLRLQGLDISNSSQIGWVREGRLLGTFWRKPKPPSVQARRAPNLSNVVKQGSENETFQEIFADHSAQAQRSAGQSRTNSESILWETRQNAVVEAFKHAWGGYKSYAMGFDELLPVSRRGTDSLGGLGATIIDALDTAMIMGVEEVVKDAGSWIEKELLDRFNEKGQVNVFETTIRVLGGLLSAYHLSGGESNFTGGVEWGGKASSHLKVPDPRIYLERARDLGDRLMSAFTSSPSPVPFSDVILKDRVAHPAKFDGGASSTSEAATLQLELWYLSKVTGDPKYGKAAMDVLEHLKTLPKVEGLVPIFLNPHTGQFQGSNIRLGSRGDSYYEYLLKVWLQQGGAGSDGLHVRYLRTMYDEAVAGIKNRLIGKSYPNELVYVGELPNGASGGLSPKMDHLVCFLAGSLALGASRGLTKEVALKQGLLTEKDLQDLNLAEELARTCFEIYNVTATGLAPEIVYFRTPEDKSEGNDGGKAGAAYARDIVIKPADRHNLLRPETVESLFVLYRVTQDPKYREWGWKIFEAFESFTKVRTGGYSSLNDVTVLSAPKRDKMETFFLGETLKYLYLLFGDITVLPLTKYVFNTEAHPLPIVWQDAERTLKSSR